ncbi:hypothetical protein EC950183_5079, partial [Escherichia coli 95.0183]
DAPAFCGGIPPAPQWFAFQP